MTNFKLMSIGSGCPLSCILRDLGIRESGPIDWVLEDQSINHLTMDLFNGNLFDHLVRKQWEMTTNFDIGKDKKGGFEIQADLLGGSYIHEDIVKDEQQWKKVLYRCLKFEKWLANGGLFARQIWEKDIHSSTGLPFFISYLKFHNIDPNRVIFLCDYFDETKHDVEDGINAKREWEERMREQAKTCEFMEFPKIHYLQQNAITHYIESDNETKERTLMDIKRALVNQWGDSYKL